MLILQAGAAWSAEFSLFPGDDPYRSYIAGPHRRGMGVVVLRLQDTDVVDSGSSYFGLVLGGRFGVARWTEQDGSGRVWQLGIDAGFYGQFDRDRSYDNLGWDGFYGLTLSAALTDDYALKIGLLHTSSHIGDEYAERTGRRRIDYTRQELVVGLSRRFRKSWRTYGEAGWGYDLRNEDLQEPGRVEIGLEYRAPRRFWKNRLGWYTAVDLSSVEERGWQLDLAADLGLQMGSPDRPWRFGLTYYDGRTPLGEFFQNDQRHLGLGLWLDF